MSNNSLGIINSLEFINKDGDVIGKLDCGGQAITFEGNAEESALVFFDLLQQAHAQWLEQEYQRGLKEKNDSTS